ncbi:MAG: hypothetical protein P8X74_00750 [Reinekea sp.]
MRKPLIPLCFPKNWGEPMAAPAIFEKQIEINGLHPASTEEVTDSGDRKPEQQHADHHAGSADCHT